MIIGAGGLGSPASLYLAGMGVGKLGIMDGDKYFFIQIQIFLKNIVI